jgi:vitamin B12 transporter
MYKLINVRFFAILMVLSTGFLPAGLMAAEVPDTARVYDIREVFVTGHYRDVVVRSSAPLNIFSAEQIDKMNVLLVSDAVKFFPGVTVRDYGGIGGLKTVSVRGLGASHTSVSYDGITVTDLQTGQIDIGRFSLDNIDLISLNSGQSDQIFQPARLFSSASQLNLKSKVPVFSGTYNLKGKVSLKSGSFGLINPSLLLQHKLNQRVILSISAEWMNAHGEYPYLLDYSYSGDGENSLEKRKNTDVKQVRNELDLYFKIAGAENLHLKAYYFDSERGLPGATILYNTDNFSSQRLHDRTFFTQAYYEKSFNPTWSLQLNAKFHTGMLHYLDSTYHNSLSRMESTYYQQELYASAATYFKPTSNWSFSLATDGFVNKMDAEFETPALTNEFVRPVRYHFLTALAAKYSAAKLVATSSLLSSMIHDEVRVGQNSRDYFKLSPYFSLLYQPFTAKDLRFRAFYKHIFRMPSFNDLYYSRVGNAHLKPETTQQLNIGFTYALNPSFRIPRFTVTADAYMNKVKDKIVALPTKNIFLWSITNLGMVDVSGIDLTAETTLRISKKTELQLSYAHNYLRAIDVTDKSGGTYGHQIPYTPRVSGSGRVAIETPLINFGYAFVWSGKRYAGFQNYAENRLPAYADHSISAYKTFIFNGLSLTARTEVLNLSDEQYAVVKWFPMPGRSYRISLGLAF